MTVSRPLPTAAPPQDPVRDDRGTTAQRDALAEALAAAALPLARRFAAGATLWCASRSTPHHARHIAVEFVHPVVVGARSFPAAVVGLDDIDGLRAQLRPGDVLLVVGDPDDAHVAAALRRCGAWGVRSVLLAEACRSPSGIADHVVAVDDTTTLLSYHLLWELTQVVFEHPGLLDEPDPCIDDVCITCSDEATVAEVASLSEDGVADALDGGRRVRVDVSLLPDVGPGDLVLVHAGLALQAVPEPVR